MPTCFVPGCKTGLASERKKNGPQDISFFRPKTDDIAKAWAKTIDRQDMVLTKSHCVCELHFLQEDIEKEYSYQMPDGSVYTVTKGRKSLKRGSVPCIFPDRSDWRPRTRKSRGDPLAIVEEYKPPDYETFLKENNYDIIARNVNLVTLPSSYWVGKVCPTFIVWNCWTENLMSSYKRVVLTSDFIIRVYINDVELQKHTYNEIKNVADIIQLLQYISTLFPCIERDIPRSKTCKGFVPARSAAAARKQALVCNACSRYRSKMRKKLEDNNAAAEKQQKKNNLLLKRFRTMVQRNERLRAQNTALKKKTEAMAGMIKIMKRRISQFNKLKANE